MERLEFDLLFRWFVGLGIDDVVWDHSTFSKNRDRLLAGEIAAKFLTAILERPRVRRLLSSDHFSVDGTLIKAWASMKSFRPRDDDYRGRRRGRNGLADFRGEKRSNDAHARTTDPDAMLYKKGLGMEAKLCFIVHGLMENHLGLTAGSHEEERGQGKIAHPAQVQIRRAGWLQPVLCLSAKTIATEP